MQNSTTKIENIVAVDAIYSIGTTDSAPEDCWEIVFPLGVGGASAQGKLRVYPPGIPRAEEGAFAVAFFCSRKVPGGTYRTGDAERALLDAIRTESGDAFARDPSTGALSVRDELSAQYVRQTLELLIIRLIRSRPESPAQTDAPQSRYFGIAANYIEEHIDSELSVESLSAFSGVSPSYLERLFRRAAGMSVIRYCRARRVERAKTLLREGRMSVTAVAAATGFSSVHYFSRTFKSLAGCAPREYARAIR